MAKLIFPFMFFAFTVFINGKLHAQMFLSSQYITTKDGLTNNKINCLFEDVKGYLWIGTEEGLTRYNGVVYEKYFANLNDPLHSLSSNAVHMFLAADDSLLLIGTSSGVNVFNLRNDRFENDLIKSPLIKAGNGEEITALCMINNRNVLAATKKYVVISDRHLNILKVLKPGTIDGRNFHFAKWHVYLNSDSSEILFNKGNFGGNGIYNSTNDSFYAASDKYKFLSSTQMLAFRAFFHPDSNTFFYSTYGKGFVTYDMHDNTSHEFEISPEGRELNCVNMIIADDILISNYWLATGMGLYLYNPGTNELTYCDISHGSGKYQNARGNYLLIDRHKTLWFGTANGLYKITRNSMLFKNVFTLEYQAMFEDGLGSGITDSSNRIWLGSYGSGLFRVEAAGGKNRKVIQIPEAGTLMIRIKIIDGKIFISSDNGILFFEEQKDKFVYPAFYPDSLKENIVTDFHKDGSGIFRVGLGAGKGMLEHNTKTANNKYYNHYFHADTSSNYLPIKQPSHIVEDKDKNLWFGYNHGDKLMFFDREKNKYTTVAINLYGNEYNIFFAASMFVDSKNRLWIGTDNLGLIVYDIVSGSASTITRAEGLPGEICNEITEDCFGNIWIGTNSGLAKYELQTGKIFSFTSKEGLPVEQVIWMSYSIIGADTTMLLGDYNSAFSFNPEKISFYSEAPSMYITKILSDNNPVNSSQNKFHYNQSHFGFEFVGINLMNGERNKYAYKLSPVDREWNYSGEIRSANYNNLIPGDYRFAVKCSNASGIWSDEVSYSFFISPAFWQTWWFKVLIALASASIVYYIYRIRAKRAAELEKMRSRISRDLHDDIGSTLSSINILSNAALSSAGKKSDLETGSVLQKINANSQNMLDNMDDIIWSINPYNDKGNKLLTRMREYATQILDAADIEIEFDFDERVDSLLLDMEQKRSIYLIFKEAVNNLAKYSQSRTATLSISLIKNFLEMKIKDTGTGFDLNSSSSGNGIMNMKKRAADVNAELNIESDSSSGTTIHLRMPV